MIFVIALLIVVAWVGYETGRNRGRDEGWNERELDRIAHEHRRNYARRNNDGTFAEKGHR